LLTILSFFFEFCAGVLRLVFFYEFCAGVLCLGSLLCVIKKKRLMFVKYATLAGNFSMYGPYQL